VRGDQVNDVMHSPKTLKQYPSLIWMIYGVKISLVTVIDLPLESVHCENITPLRVDLTIPEVAWDKKHDGNIIYR
jgi:hypothetical protein